MPIFLSNFLAENITITSEKDNETPTTNQSISVYLGDITVPYGKHKFSTG